MVQLNGKSPVTRLAATVCPVKVRYYHKNPFFLCAVKYKLAISPIGCCPRGSNVLCVGDRFPHGEIALGKFPWKRQKEQKNATSHSSPGRGRKGRGGGYKYRQIAQNYF